MSEQNPMVEHVPTVTVINSDGAELLYYVLLGNVYGPNKLVPFLMHESMFNSLRLLIEFWRTIAVDDCELAVLSFSVPVNSIAHYQALQHELDVFPRILFQECKVADVMQGLYLPSARAHISARDDGDGNLFLSLSTDTEEIVEFTVDVRKHSVVTVQEATAMFQHRKDMYQRNCWEYVQDNLRQPNHFPNYNA
jgi:hypothetical protein